MAWLTNYELDATNQWPLPVCLLLRFIPLSSLTSCIVRYLHWRCLSLPRRNDPMRMRRMRTMGRPSCLQVSRIWRFLALSALFHNARTHAPFPVRSHSVPPLAGSYIHLRGPRRASRRRAVPGPGAVQQYAQLISAGGRNVINKNLFASFNSDSQFLQYLMNARLGFVCPVAVVMKG